MKWLVALLIMPLLSASAQHSDTTKLRLEIQAGVGIAKKISNVNFATKSIGTSILGFSVEYEIIKNLAIGLRVLNVKANNESNQSNISVASYDGVSTLFSTHYFFPMSARFRLFGGVGFGPMAGSLAVYDRVNDERYKALISGFGYAVNFGARANFTPRIAASARFELAKMNNAYKRESVNANSGAGTNQSTPQRARVNLFGPRIVVGISYGIF